MFFFPSLKIGVFPFPKGLIGVFLCFRNRKGVFFWKGVDGNWKKFYGIVSLLA